MSLESAKAYVERLKTDEEFAKKASELKNSEERMEFAKAEGYDFTIEEIKEVSSELEDDELDNVAGAGCKCTTIIHEGNII